MKAVVFEGGSNVQVQDQQQPQVTGPKDALLRVTTSAIGGSDLHMYEGRTELQPGQIVGHEIMGVIEEVGQAVTGLKKGDRVVLPFNIACGYCHNCLRGYTNMCLTMDERRPHAAYGYVGMGPYSGGQAEYVVVPNADFNCLKLPGRPFDEWEDDFVLLADVFPTGYYATDLAHVRAGKSVAVFGAGPVGLMSALSALIRGAAEVYVIDFIPERLAKAKELGAIAIDIRKGDPVEQIMSGRAESASLRDRLLPGEDKLNGVDCVIDAVGYQARNDKDYGQEHSTQVLHNMVRLVNPAGHIGIVGVYLAPDPGARSEQEKGGVFSMPMADLFDKGVTLGMGQCPVKWYNQYLRDLIIAGRVKPSKIISHRIAIENAPEAYEKFDRRVEGYTKVLIKFSPPRAA